MVIAGGSRCLPSLITVQSAPAVLFKKQTNGGMQKHASTVGRKKPKALQTKQFFEPEIVSTCFCALMTLTSFTPKALL